MNKQDNEKVDGWNEYFISIDFGTAFSGFSFCKASAKDISKIVVPSNWCSGFNNYKNNSAILYNKDDPMSWGQEAIRDYKNIYNENKSEIDNYTLVQDAFKLKIKTKESVDINGKKISITKVVADFLSLMKQTIAKMIKNQQGIEFDQISAKWCVTVPAIWDDGDKDLMRKAVEIAKLVDEEKLHDLKWFRFALEPEAAAVHCRSALISNPLQNNDAFLVLDAGGGTIDITTYQINDVVDNKPDSGKLREIHKASGDTMGGEYVTNHIIAAINAKLKAVKLPTTGYSGFVLRNNINEAKTKFNQKAKKLLISCPRSILKSIKYDVGATQCVDEDEGALFLSTQEVQKCFEGSIEVAKNHIAKIIQAIKEKDNITLKYIYCVGGFSECDLFFDAIKQSFETKETNVLRPPNPGHSVVLGATWFIVYPSIIKGRILPRAYGIAVRVPYEAKKHGKYEEHAFLIKNEKFIGKFYPFTKVKQYMEVGTVVVNVVEEKVYDTVHLVIYSHENDDSNEEIEHYICEKGMKKLGTLPITQALGAIIKVYFYFGDTELKIEAIKENTNEKMSCFLDYESNKQVTVEKELASNNDAVVKKEHNQNNETQKEKFLKPV